MPGLPIPTDNVFKFMAMGGLTGIIAIAAITLTYHYKATNDSDVAKVRHDASVSELENLEFRLVEINWDTLRILGETNAIPEAEYQQIIKEYLPLYISENIEDRRSLRSKLSIYLTNLYRHFLLETDPNKFTELMKLENAHKFDAPKDLHNTRKFELIYLKKINVDGLERLRENTKRIDDLLDDFEIAIRAHIEAEQLITQSENASDVSRKLKIFAYISCPLLLPICLTGFIVWFRSYPVDKKG